MNKLKFRKTLALVVVFMFVFTSVAAAAVPSNTIIVGENAVDIDHFIANPTAVLALLQADIEALSPVYVYTEGANIFDVFTNNEVTQQAIDAQVKYLYDAQGNKTTIAVSSVASVIAINSTTVTVNFTSYQTSVAATDFTVSQNGANIAVSNATLASDGLSATLTLSNALANGAFTVNGTSATINLVAPALQSAQVNGTSLVLTFDQELNSNSIPVSTDFKVSAHGVPVAVQSYVLVSGNSVTLILASPLVTTDINTISYTIGTAPIESLTNTPVAGFNAQSISTMPVAAATAVKAVPASGGTATVTWSAPVSGPIADDYAVLVSVNGGAYTAAPITAPITGLSYTYIGTDGQSVQFEVVSHNNATATSATSTASTAITLDATAPKIASATVNGNQLVLTYDSTLAATTTTNISGDFTIVASTATANITNATVSGNQVTLTLNRSVLSTETVTVSSQVNYAADVKDVAGNAAPVLSNLSVTNQTTANTATLIDKNSLTTIGGIVLEQFALTDTVSSAVYLDAARVTNITVTKPDGSMAAVSPTLDSNPNYLDFAVTNPAGTYTYKVVSSTGVVYTATLNWAGVISGTAKLADNTATEYKFNVYPSAISTIPESFSSAYVVQPDGTQVKLSVTGVVTTEPVSVANNQVVFTSAPVGVYTVYVQDSTSYTWYSATVSIPSATVPTLATAAVDIINPAQIVLVYNETLAPLSTSASSAHLSQFSVNVAGTNATIDSVAINSNSKSVILTLASPIKVGQAVTVSYAAPTTGAIITDLANQQAAVSFQNQSVTNNTQAPNLVNASVFANNLTLTYSKAVSAVGPVSATYFTVTVAGAPDAVVSVTVGGGTSQNEVVLNLNTEPPVGSQVLVSYTPGTPLITDAAGNAIAGLSSQAVINSN